MYVSLQWIYITHSIRCYCKLTGEVFDGNDNILHTYFDTVAQHVHVETFPFQYILPGEAFWKVLTTSPILLFICLSSKRIKQKGGKANSALLFFLTLKGKVNKKRLYSNAGLLVQKVTTMSQRHSGNFQVRGTFVEADIQMKQKRKQCQESVNTLNRNKWRREDERKTTCQTTFVKYKNKKKNKKK